MQNRVYQCTKARIIATKASYGFLALLVPFMFYMAINYMNVTFDNVVVMLACLLTLLVIFIAYYEGKVAIRILKKHRLEVNDEHLLHIGDRKKEMILYGDIECIKVVKSITGKVKKLKIITPYREMSIEGYESLDQVLNYLEDDKGILIKG